MGDSSGKRGRRRFRMNSERPTDWDRMRLKTRSARLIVAGDSIVCRIRSVYRSPLKSSTKSAASADFWLESVTAARTRASDCFDSRSRTGLRFSRKRTPRFGSFFSVPTTIRPSDRYVCRGRNGARESSSRIFEKSSSFSTTRASSVSALPRLCGPRLAPLPLETWLSRKRRKDARSSFPSPRRCVVRRARCDTPERTTATSSTKFFNEACDFSNGERGR